MKLRKIARTWKLTLILIIAVVSITFSPAQAQQERATVRLDGRAVFRVSSVKDREATERAQQIERRMAILLENPDAIAPSLIRPTGANNTERVISIAGVPIATVTITDAQDNLTTVDALAKQWSQAIDSAIQDASQRRLSPWARFTTQVRSSVETAFARLIESVIMIVPRTLAAFVVIGLFWLIANGVRWLIQKICYHFIEDLTIQNLLKQVAYYTVWVLGIIVALDAFGFDPQTVVTGLGLTSLALGFALKDIISNFISGILLLALRPFRLGDQIIIGDIEGNVEGIELRATQLRTYDGVVVLVPNAEVFTSRIINNTANPIRRGNVIVFLDYDRDLQQIVTAVCNAVQNTAGVLSEPRVSVGIRELDKDKITLQVNFWTDSQRSDFVETRSTVRKTIITALNNLSNN
ncbi:mechanosensitive ion channel family protein [Floridanema aerugineum]|uniref:Mechanosensitive ion channel family protein n=1 Tax=Floridaenema aerugineum BLCC-F46 TaxID=3153654 RepID=A0ABV4X1Z2_9CYAN